MTTFEPGASDVLTHGLTFRPRSTALRASRPAPSMTDGFDVFVHDVIAAITTWPWSSLKLSPSSVTSTAVAERSATRAPAATVELDELADDALLAQQLGDGEDEVGRGRALGQRAG